jgi:coenzyme F420 hydrogenase subunit beta
MGKKENIRYTVDQNLCISCGSCAFINKNRGFAFNIQKYKYEPKFSGKADDIGTDFEYDICPGKGYELQRLSSELFKGDVIHDDLIGYFYNTYAVHSTDKNILSNASSGGVITAISTYLLSTHRVQGIIASKFSFGDEGPKPETNIVTKVEDLKEYQGSKYLPVPVNLVLSNAENFEGDLAFIGTPCQIAGLRMIQEKNIVLKDKIKFVIGVFCGGFKDPRDMFCMIKRHGYDPAAVTSFQYRGNGQPGSMVIKDRSGKQTSRPYPDYVSDTGYQKYNRCRLCIDGSAELADFSCGDAWVKRLLDTKTPWSILITRQPEADQLIKEMVAADILAETEISLDEIKKSQKTNLESKKIRQKARRELYTILKLPIPIYDGGFRESPTSLLLEAKVYIKHSFLTALEYFGLYVGVRNLRNFAKRIP